LPFRFWQLPLPVQFRHNSRWLLIAWAQELPLSAKAPTLPVEKIGPDDLIGITVYDAPELTRTVRVDAGGDIRLPMVPQHIKAAGLYPAELEKAISTVLIQENVLVDPVVTVSVVEYRSRPITVAGAVKTPVTFQATGTVTLLDAITRAGGLTENAGRKSWSASRHRK
jgi:polysaccharide export outer membrane protein